MRKKDGEKMKVYKIELMIIDFDNVGEKESVEVIENARYPNRCISPKVMSIESRDIGEWHDNHPLNKKSLQKTEYDRIFTTKEKL